MTYIFVALDDLGEDVLANAHDLCSVVVVDHDEFQFGLESRRLLREIARTILLLPVELLCLLKLLRLFIVLGLLLFNLRLKIGNEDILIRNNSEILFFLRCLAIEVFF